MVEKEVVCITIPNNMTDEQWEAFNKVMDEYYEAQNEYVENLAKELNVSFECAGLVDYLRSRSRWTQEIENELILSYTDTKYEPISFNLVLTGEWRGGLTLRG